MEVAVEGGGAQPLRPLVTPEAGGRGEDVGEQDVLAALAVLEHHGGVVEVVGALRLDVVAPAQAVDEPDHPGSRAGLGPVVATALVASVGDAKHFRSGRELAANETYVEGEAVTIAGAQFTISGEPADGDTFYVQTAEKQSVFTTVEKVIDGLENFSATPSYRQAFDNLLENSLANLDNAQNSVLEVRTRVGARLNTVETTRQFHEDSNLLNTEVKSDLEDLDYAKAVSRLSQQNFVLQAAQRSFAQVSRLSLFDSL